METKTALDSLLDRVQEAVPDATDVATAIRPLIEETCLVFPFYLHRRVAEGLIEKGREAQKKWREAEDALTLSPSERLTQVVKVSDGSFVCEVTGGAFTSEERPSTWRVVADGERDNECHYTLDMALLRLIELRNGGDGGRAFVYAARVLAVDVVKDV